MNYPGSEQQSWTNVRPERVCYVVRDNYLPQLEEAMTAASLRWAGATEPILAVTQTGFADQRWHQILTALQPDVLVDMGLEDQERQFISEQAQKELTSWSDFTGSHPGYPSAWQHPLLVSEYPSLPDPFPFSVSP